MSHPTEPDRFAEGRRVCGFAWWRAVWAVPVLVGTMLVAAVSPAAAQDAVPDTTHQDTTDRDSLQRETAQRDTVRFRVPSRPDLHRDTIDTFQPQPYTLRPFVLPGSERVVLEGQRLDTTAYRLDYRYGRLFIERPGRLPADARLVVRYRTLPFRLQEVYRRRVRDTTKARTAEAGGRSDSLTRRGGPGPAPADTSRWGAVRLVTPDSTTADTSGGFDPFAGVNLQRRGSISRGLISGNRRDVNVESGLRLQLDGEIVEGVNVRAALTDQNTPIQPEGTTQRLNDFDRVFVEIDAPPGTARLGDIDVDLEESAFVSFNRKLQGGALSSQRLDAVPGLSSGSVTGIGAVSRGIFRTQDIQPIDGVQGPYRLEGRNGERFIIVVAGSERVFLDGERLTRGETNDYVIDYTRGEITFTADRLITEDQRITVEFEYRTQQFSRSLVGGQARVGAWPGGHGGGDRVQVGATVLREADSRRFGPELDLSRADSLRIVESGDEQAVRSGAQRVPFDAEAPYVQYRRVARTQPDGTVDSVFTALDTAPADSMPVFRVRFSRVGAEEGSYERVGRQVNGILYEYVGDGNGDYAPVEPLPQPQLRRLVSVTGQVEPIRGVQLFGEWAGSLNDQNRLSSLDSGDDQGSAVRAGLRLQPTDLSWGRQGLGTLSGEVSVRQRGRNFSSFNRTRPVEFGRRWNLAERGFNASSGLTAAADEATGEGRLRWALTDRSFVEGSVGRLQLGRAFTGWRRAGNLQVGEPGWPQLDYRVEYITSTNRRDGTEGVWLRQRGGIERSFGGGLVTPRLEIEQERRRLATLGPDGAPTDSLDRGSLSFVEYRPGLGMQAGAFSLNGTVAYRTERDWIEGQLRDAETAWTVKGDAAYDPHDALRVETTVGYRARRVTDRFRVAQQRQDNESLILRLDADAEALDRGVSLRAYYEGQTERTPTLQEIYVRTGPELGQYVWVDSNENGIVEVGEFVPETTPNEGAYVQTFVPSDSLESVASVQSRLRLEVRPRRLVGDGEAWWRQALRQVEARSTAEVREKNRSADPLQIYVLNLRRFRTPGATIDGQLRLEQKVFLFRRSTRYGATLTHEQVRSLSERAAGQQRQTTRTWRAEATYRPSATWAVKAEGALRTDRNASEAFRQARSYDIQTRSVEPEVTFQPGSAWRLTGGLVYAQKRDAVEGRRARVLRVPLQARLAEAGRFQVTLRGEVANVDLTGEAVGLARFELTDGRGPGTSYLWGVDGQYQINDYLRATVAYDGRAPADAPTVNTFRVNLSAQF